MRRYSKASADRVASVRIDLLPQQQYSGSSSSAISSSSSLSPELFKALVSSSAVVGALNDAMGLLFGASSCRIDLSGANVGRRELAVHIYAAGGGGASSSSLSATAVGGVDQLRAACALVTVLPVGQRTVGLLAKPCGGAEEQMGNDGGDGAEDDFMEDTGNNSNEAAAGSEVSLAAQLKRYVAPVGEGEWVLPCRLTVARVQ